MHQIIAERAAQLAHATAACRWLRRGDRRLYLAHLGAAAAHQAAANDPTDPFLGRIAAAAAQEVQLIAPTYKAEQFLEHGGVLLQNSGELGLEEGEAPASHLDISHEDGARVVPYRLHAVQRVGTEVRAWYYVAEGGASLAIYNE